MAEQPTRKAGSPSTWTPRTSTGCVEHTAEKRRLFNESMAKLFDPEFMAEQDDTEAAMEGGRSGAYDADRRIVELQADGIVADVIFPDGTQDNTTPFDASSGPGAKGADWELQTVGAWAYNRWLADFCALHPGRHAGIAVITVHDLDETVRQVTWAKEHDLRGVLLPAGVGHAAVLQPPALRALVGSVRGPRDAAAHARRLRRPRLRRPSRCQRAVRDGEHVLLTPAVLVPDLGRRVREPPGSHDGLRRAGFGLGARHAPDDGQHVRLHVPARAGTPEVAPERVLASAVLRASDVLPASEANLRHEIGIENMLWGSDYPHYEGSWPNSRKVIHEALHGAPESEIRAILGENAARVYGFDLAAARSDRGRRRTDDRRDLERIRPFRVHE